MLSFLPIQSSSRHERKITYPLPYHGLAGITCFLSVITTSIFPNTLSVMNSRVHWLEKCCMETNLYSINKYNMTQVCLVRRKTHWSEKNLHGLQGALSESLILALVGNRAKKSGINGIQFIYRETKVIKLFSSVLVLNIIKLKGIVTVGVT